MITVNNTTNDEKVNNLNEVFNEKIGKVGKNIKNLLPIQKKTVYLHRKIQRVELYDYKFKFVVFRPD